MVGCWCFVQFGITLCWYDCCYYVNNDDGSDGDDGDPMIVFPVKIIKFTVEVSHRIF